MPVRSLKRIPVFAWIPPTYDALYKIEVIRADDTTDDITDFIISGSLTDGVTNTIGNFEFEIDNSGENRTGIWANNDTLELYMDYATSATTLRFKGIIDKVSYRNNTVVIVGRSESAKLMDISVTKAYTDQEASTIIKDLFDNYAIDFTYTNVDTSTSNITVNWYQKPFWDCIRDICEAVDFDAYIDVESDCHFFERGTVNNTTEAVVHDSNILDIGDFAYDQSQLKNRVIVYGADIGDLPLFKTAEDETSQEKYGIKELIIKDKNITTESQCEERADYELSRSKDPVIIGEITSKGLATLQPGERVRISAPESNLNPSYYKIASYRHEIDNGFMQTILAVEKEPVKIQHLFRDRISQEQKLSETPNPYEMRYSWNFDFETDSGAHSTTQITDSVLKTTNGSGTWTSENKSLTSNAVSVELRARGNNLAGTTYSVSSDAGISWQSITPNSELDLSPPGATLRIKIDINSSATEIDSLVLLYK